MYQIQDGGQNTLHAALTKYARSEALTRHCRFTVCFMGFKSFQRIFQGRSSGLLSFDLTIHMYVLLGSYMFMSIVAACSVKIIS